MAKPAPNLGSVIIHDARLNIDRLFPVTKVELRDRGLYIEASGPITIGGELRDDDVVTLRDPDGHTVCRTWINTAFDTHLNPREIFTLMMPIPLGGPRPVITGDSSLDIDL